MQARRPPRPVRAVFPRSGAGRSAGLERVDDRQHRGEADEQRDGRMHGVPSSHCRGANLDYNGRLASHQRRPRARSLSRTTSTDRLKRDSLTDTPDDPAGRRRPAPVMLEEEMRRSYLDYAMSVIVSPALPDARDGLSRCIAASSTRCRKRATRRTSLSQVAASWRGDGQIPSARR